MMQGHFMSIGLEKIEAFLKRKGGFSHENRLATIAIRATKTNFKGNKLEDIPNDLLIREYLN